ncbi:MAG: zinc metallopeptidase [Candidatus Coproplasma sp.]
MAEFTNWVRELADGAFNGVSDGVIIAMSIVSGLLIIASIFAFFVSVYLACKYVVYNKKRNSCGKTGEQVARTILDRNGLQKIKVSATGSILFGNSYSHYFKKVRLRRLTWKKDSVTSLAMAAQKSALAVLDKEKDPDMKARVRMTPVIYFGPVAFVPLVLIGVLLDVLVFTNANGLCTFILTCIASLIYVLSFVMSILVLKTEKKAQKRAYEIMKEQGIATAEELEMCKKLFRLYNIEYINDMIIALLELIYRVLQIIAYAQSSSSSSNS